MYSRINTVLNVLQIFNPTCYPSSSSIKVCRVFLSTYISIYIFYLKAAQLYGVCGLFVIGIDGKVVMNEFNRFAN